MCHVAVVVMVRVLHSPRPLLVTHGGGDNFSEDSREAYERNLRRENDESRVVSSMRNRGSERDDESATPSLLRALELLNVRLARLERLLNIQKS